ncbi:MAG TPA: TonB-dependent siderophore receptor [Thermoanaerobaculia bacterium]|nr:TonB-dependent siderophore receptor [Thermoanaerobaculia bacterium]
MKRPNPFRPWLLACTFACLSLGSLSAAIAAEPGTEAAGRNSIPLEGRVLDPAGIPIAGARVSAVAPGRGGEPQTAVSAADGRFALALPAGNYDLEIEVEGVVENMPRVTVTPDRSGPIDLVFEAALQESITVRSSTGYQIPTLRSGTKTLTPLSDVPQSITVVTRQLMQDQLMTSIGDVVRYVPGISLHQGENNRDQVIIRGNSSSADFFVDGVRDDVQYYRDLYNLDRVEALKGPNAMIFGRGGSGGVINRVTKEAGFDTAREIDLQGGSYSNKRVTADLDQPISDKLALRFNGLYEDSGSFRNQVDLERTGVAPSLTYRQSDATKITFGYEHLRDVRTADRGITSFLGKPADVAIDTFYGDPNQSHVRASVDLAAVTFDHQFGGLDGWNLRNRTLYGSYDRFYQNFVPGAVSANKSLVTLTAYNNATQRDNLFNQTDLTYALETGTIRHTLLVGAEVGHQVTDNFRNTGFFNNSATSVLVPYAHPTIQTPVTFRQNATDADNHLTAQVGALYAQDQIALSSRLQVVAGLRFDRFDLEYENRRNGDRLDRADNLVSPRLGLIVKPTAELSLYGNYSVSYLPSSGDQFSSLTSITEQVKPEELNNYEVGAKWDPTERLSLTAAVYRLDRTNTRSTDPNDPTRIVQTGKQRSSGGEIGVNGQFTSAWSVAGGYAYQDATILSATVAARKGATVGQVPRHTISLWNNVQFLPKLGAALGLVYRSEMFATIDDTVTLPGYTRVDAAVYFTLTKDFRLQLNVENLLDKKYWANADSNTNLSPGSPRAVRLGLTTRM